MRGGSAMTNFTYFLSFVGAFALVKWLFDLIAFIERRRRA